MENFVHGCVAVERVNASDELLQEFGQIHRMKHPVIISNYANAGDNVQQWSNSKHLLPRVTTEHIEVLVAKDGRHFMKHDYCNTLHKNAVDVIRDIMEETTPERMYCRLYLDQEPELANDIHLDYMSRLVEGVSGQPYHFIDKNVGVWISTAGCITPLHYDTCHGFLLQVHGRKRFLLASPDDSMYLYRNRNIHSKNQMTSDVNLTSWIEHDTEQRKQYSKVSEVVWHVAELFPGDMLYTPPGWWHHVTSLDTSISVLCPFDMQGSESLSTLLSL